MHALPITTVQFDAKASHLEALTRDWADRECTTFDEAVRRAAGIDDGGGGSIWDMPTIDSKRTVSLLVELEAVLACKLPVSLVKRGGYATTDILVDHLLSRVRQLCTDAMKPGAPTVAITTSAAQSAPSRMLP